MRRLLASSALLLSVALLMAACGDDDDDSASVAPAATPTTTTTAAAAGGATTTGGASGGYDYGGGASTATTAAAATATTAAAAGGATATTAAAAESDEGGPLALADTSAGKVLADDEGRTVYVFTPDAQGASTCYDSCAQTWPYVDAASGVGTGLDASKLGTTMRKDGEAQATYAGWPLYTFGGDTKAGDVNGIGVAGKWFAIDASGAQVSK